MRLRWYRGVVVENAILTRTDAPAGPELSAREAEFDLRGSPFRRSGLKLKSIILRDARLSVPVPVGGGKKLDFGKIQTRLLFPEPDLLKLDSFKTIVGGIAIQATGSITNISAGRDWPVFKNIPGRHQRAEKNLEQLLDILEQIQLSGRSEANVAFEGTPDGRKKFMPPSNCAFPSSMRPGEIFPACRSMENGRGFHPPRAGAGQWFAWLLTRPRANGRAEKASSG